MPGQGGDEAHDDANGKHERKDSLSAARDAAAAAYGSRNGDVGKRKGDVDEADLVARHAVAESDMASEAPRMLHEVCQHGRVHPRDSRVGEAKEPGADETVVGAERLCSVGIDAPRPGMAVDHVVVVAGDDGHHQTG